MQTEQALTTANLNLEENQQRKSILNAMMGTRVYKGSSLSRALVGNTPGQGGENAVSAPSAAQTDSTPISVAGKSLLDQVRSSAASSAASATGSVSGASSSGTSGGASRLGV